MRWSPVLAALLLVALPQAAEAEEADDFFCVIFVTPTPDFRSLEVVVDLVLTEKVMTNLTAAVDADRDGAITAGEVIAYETAHMENFTWPTWDALGHRKAFLNGAVPSWAALSVRLLGFEGSAGANATRRVQEVRSYEFDLVFERSTAYRLYGGNESAYEPPAVIETVVFTAPHGWVVALVNETEYHERIVTIRHFDTQGYWSVTFAREQVPPDPVLQAALTLLLVLLVAAVAIAAFVSLQERRARGQA